MDFLADEQYYAQRIIDFWSAHRSKFYLILLLSFIGVGASTYWDYEVKQRKQAAFDHYMTFVTSLEDDDKASVGRTAKILKEHFGSSIYTSLALMRQVKIHIEDEEYEPARDVLMWLIQNSSSSQIQVMSKVKLTELYLATKQYTNAIAMMEQLGEYDIPQTLHEMKGDLFTLRGDYEEAIKHYMEIVSSDETPVDVKEMMIAKVNYIFEKRIV